MSNALHAMTPAAAPLQTCRPNCAMPSLPAAWRYRVLRFFGLRVYEARLWAAPGFLPEDYARHPFALELVYDRKLEGAAIAERSIRRCAAGSFTEAQSRQWLELMQQAFPDVSPGPAAGPE
jgi:hypothetical protein